MTTHLTRIIGNGGGSDFVLFYFALNAMFWPENNTINNTRVVSDFQRLTDLQTAIGRVHFFVNH